MSLDDAIPSQKLFCLTTVAKLKVKMFVNSTQSTEDQNQASRETAPLHLSRKKPLTLRYFFLSDGHILLSPTHYHYFTTKLLVLPCGDQRDIWVNTAPTSYGNFNIHQPKDPDTK